MKIYTNSIKIIKGVSSNLDISLCLVFFVHNLSYIKVRETDPENCTRIQMQYLRNPWSHVITLRKAQNPDMHMIFIIRGKVHEIFIFYKFKWDFY